MHFFHLLIQISYVDSRAECLNNLILFLIRKQLKSEIRLQAWILQLKQLVSIFKKQEKNCVSVYHADLEILALSPPIELMIE